MSLLNHENPKPWVSIFGATGSGKSRLAIKMALDLQDCYRRPCVIVSCDSVAVYRRFDVGAAKPSQADRQLVPHEMLDLVDWHEDFDADDFAKIARGVMEASWARGQIPIVVGGTGLYLRALQGERFDHAVPKDVVLRGQLELLPNQKLYELLESLNPHRARALHPNDRVRLVRAIEIARYQPQPSADEVALEQLGGGSPPLIGAAAVQSTTPWSKPSLAVALDPPRPVLHKQIALRTQTMLESGLVHEVQSLIDDGVPAGCKPMSSIGYKETCAVLLKNSPGWELRELGELGELSERIKAATRQYAKRQCTWFKRVPRDLTLSSAGDWAHL